MNIKPILNRINGKQKVVLLTVFLIPIILLQVLNYFSNPAHGENNKSVIEIPRGSALSQIADSLKAKSLIEDKEMFIFWAKSLGYEKKLKAGYFNIPHDLNEFQLVKYLTKAKENTFSLRLLEGWDLAQIAETIAKNTVTTPKEILERCTDSTYISRFNLDVSSLEGYLLPDTYYFAKGESADDILKHLINQTLMIFEEDSVKQALKEINLNQHQVITLASIVEGEAVLDAERPIVSSLYHNRLKKRMKLQADPTIQYVIEGPPRRLLNRDLKIDSPYNTYKYRGLPPGPINNPGKASILATIFPAKTDYIFMVAVGDGSHTFSVTLMEHNKAKAAFDNVRRQVARERRRKGN